MLAPTSLTLLPPKGAEPAPSERLRAREWRALDIRPASRMALSRLGAARRRWRLTPRANAPSDLTKPDEALFDSVNSGAFEPAARSAFMPSAHAVPEPMNSTARASPATMRGSIFKKSGLARSCCSCSLGQAAGAQQGKQTAQQAAA